MKELEKILEEIDKTMECGLIDYINGDPVITKKKAKDIIRKHMDGAEYPYIIGKDIEAVPPASKEFLDECRSVAKKYGKMMDGSRLRKNCRKRAKTYCYAAMMGE